MKKYSLAGAWEFRQAGTEEWLPATVPGGVHTDLLALGRIPDPFVADNEKRVQWIAESDWIYRCEFVCSPELLAEEKIFLVCEGLDTLATVVLNDNELGRTANMFRRYEWEIKPLLHAVGENILEIAFASPVDTFRRSTLFEKCQVLTIHCRVARIFVKLPANLAGIGDHSSRQSASGKISAWRVTVRHDCQKSIYARITAMER